MATQEVRLGTLTLQPHRQLLADGAPVPLGRKPLDILSVLAHAKGQLVTKDELMNAVWPGLVVEENAIQAHMVALRRALGHEAERLKTVRGFGYRLEMPASRFAGTPASQAPGIPPSVAVLPFANLTGDPANDYLGEGMAEELICTLARAPDLNVPARTSTFAYKGQDRDIREIGRELGVTSLLEGSVRLAGTRIRVTAQLIDSATGFHLWSQNYDRDVADLIALQDDIAKSIAAALDAKLTRPRQRTADTEAFDLVLRGRSLIDRGSPQNLLRAITLFRQAIALDGEFVDARVGLAKALLYACSSGILSPDQYRESREQARLACELDPDNPAAHFAFACGMARIGEWVTAGRHLERSIALQEADADVHCVYGGAFLVFVGRLEEAERHVRRARELAPAAAMAHVVSGGLKLVRGEDDAAEHYLASAVELGFPEAARPLSGYRAAQAQRSGDFDAAARHDMSGWPQLAKGDVPDLVLTVRAAASGAASRADGSSALIRLVETARSGEWIGRYLSFGAYLMDWALLLDDRASVHAVADLILDGWNQSGVLDLGAHSPIWVRGREHWRDDPYLDAFFDRIGLKAYWEAFGPPDA